MYFFDIVGATQGQIVTITAQTSNRFGGPGEGGYGHAVLGGLTFDTLRVVPAPGSLITALIGIVPGVMLLRRRRKSVR